MIIKSIRCVNFRAFEDRTFEFGRVNYIDGENYKGKSSIGEAIVTLLLGTTIEGSPQVGDLIRNGEKKFELTGVIDVNGEEHEIYRSRDSRKTTIQLDGNRSTQAEIDRFIGAKERFLTVFTPGYFAGLSNPVAREMIIGLTKRPKPEEIVARIQAHAAHLTFNDQPLKELRDPESFAKGIRADIKSNDAEQNRIRGRIEVYQEQLRAEAPPVPEHDLGELESYRAELEQIRNGGTVQKINQMDNERRQLKRRLESIRLQDVPDAPHALGDPCPMCLRPLDEQSLDDVLRHHHEIVEQIEDDNADKLTEQVELEERIDTLTSDINTLMETIDESRIDYLTDEIRRLGDLEYEMKVARAKLDQHNQTIESAATNINKSENDLNDLLHESFNLSETLKAIAEFRQELVKIQVESIKKHLDRVGIELFKFTQDGDINDDFVLTYDGRDYKVLSTSERIRVNLEIASLFNTVLGLEFPVFIDNAESITHYTSPNASQVFLARVVEGSELKLEVVD